MVQGFYSLPPGSPSLEDALKLINEQLENARNSSDASKKSQFCEDVESKLKDAEQIFTATRVGHLTQDDGIANAYHEHAVFLDDLKSHDKANKSYQKAKEWGYVHVPNQLTSFPRPSNTPGSINQPIGPSIASLAVPAIATANNQDNLDLGVSQSTILSNSQRVVPKTNFDTATIQRKTFHQDVVLSLGKHTLPENTRNITSTPQLAYCLSLLLPSSISKEELDETEFEWSQDKINNPDEQDRLQTVATDMVREFVRDVLKTPDVVAEVVCLAAVLDKDVFRKLLQAFVDGIDQSVLLKVHLLDGLAHLIGNAAPGCIDTDDLVKILELLSMRLKGTHQQSTQHILQLIQTVSCVLDSMVVSQVNDLKREQLHEPLLAYLKGLRGGSDPCLAYQAAYAYQALQFIPDDETTFQAALRRTGKVVQGISGVINAVKSLDLNGLMNGLQGIHGGLADARNAIVAAKDAYLHAKELSEGGNLIFGSLKESLSLGSKRAWYPALRGLDLLLQEGRLVEFEKLIREAPCRQDPAFQFGVCQRLRDVAANPLWDLDTRQCALSFLGEMYRDDAMWNQEADVKEWILSILTQLSHLPDDALSGHLEKQFQELEVDRSLLETHTKGYSSSYPVMTSLRFQTSPLLDRVLNKPDVEAAVRQLRSNRLGERSEDVYISPRGRASKASKEDFDLSSKVQEFLSSKKKVLLLLGDSGAGKSTFNRALEISLWDKYEKNGRIPIFIHLPTIDNPEYDLIEKQLRNANFTMIQIRELKATREFILICDGYDESQQTRNLYMSNQLNQIGGWQAQMMIGCRTEYTGVDYKDQFQPTNRSTGRDLGLMQELIIEPFNKDQIQDYINQYVSLTKPSWESKDYIQALKQIPNLQDLVRNPFLLKMALHVLPTMAETTSNFSTVRITRVELYDTFVMQWLERSKKRFGEIDLSEMDMESFKVLSSFGFVPHGLTYLKELSTAVYDNQGGNPTIKYSVHYDRMTWKEAYLGKLNGNNLLQESIPLVRNGDLYRFLHKSVLEYGLSLAIFDPNAQVEDMNPGHVPSRRGSTSSILSFEIQETSEEKAAAIEQSLLESPLGKRSLVNEPSIIQFLVERVQQQPVFKDQLHVIIELSKTDKTARIAAANSITILVQAGVQFAGADLRGIKVPGANLSYGVFDSAQMEGADLRKTNLWNAWLRQANLSEAQMGGVQFGELPYLQEDDVVETCTYSPNGETYAVGLRNGNINLYDTTSWDIVQTSKGHSKRLTSLTYSPDGEMFASGSLDNTVRLWNVDTGSCVHILQGHDNCITIVVYSPKGDQIASGSQDKTVRLWDVETGNCVHTLQGHTLDVWSIAYSPKADQITSGSYDSTVRLWDVETGNCVLTLQGHSGAVRSVVYSPKGDQIASGSNDKTIRVWDVETGNHIHTLEGHSDSVRSVVYSPKGDRIASGSEDQTVRLWEVETGDCIHTLQGHGGSVLSVAYSPKGGQIVSGSSDRTVRLWDDEVGNCIGTLQGHSGSIRSVMYSPRGDRIASGGGDNTVRLWYAEVGNSVYTLQGRSHNVTSFAYSVKRGQVAFGSEDETVQLWDVEAGKNVHILQGHSGAVASVVYSPEGDQIASGGRDKTVRLWDIETGNCVRTLQGHTKSVECVTYSPKGDRIASGSLDFSIRLWDVESGNCAWTSESVSHVWNIAYSPKGDRIASGGFSSTVELWDVDTGNCIHALQGHSNRVGNVVYSPKGDQFASGSDDRTIRLWDVQTGNCVHTLQGHRDNIRSVVYSPKGDQIATGSSDSTLRLWDVDTGDCVHTLQGHGGSVLSVAFSPEGDQIASGSWDKTVRLWDTQTGQCLVVIQGFDGDVKSLSWRKSLGQQYIVTGCQDTSVRYWRIVKEGDGLKALLSWGSSHHVLTVFDASLSDVQALSMVNRKLLYQRGASSS